MNGKQARKRVGKYVGQRGIAGVGGGGVASSHQIRVRGHG